MTQDNLDLDTLELHASSELAEASERCEARSGDDNHSLLRNQRGSGFVEKILIIALFCFAVIAGLNAISGSVTNALTTEGTNIESVASSTNLTSGGDGSGAPSGGTTTPPPSMGGI